MSGVRVSGRSVCRGGIYPILVGGLSLSLSLKVRNSLSLFSIEAFLKVEKVAIGGPLAGFL